MNIDLPRDIEALQEAFVRCHVLEAREPGGGRWPFAGDGPWQLIVRDANDWWRGEWSATLDVGEDGREREVMKRDEPSPRTPLSSAEVDDLAALRRWLLLVPDAAHPLASDHDRRLVWLATGRLARGDVGDGGRVPWGEVKRWLGSPRSADTLARRYRHALGKVLCRLHGWPLRRAAALARGEAEQVAESSFGERVFMGEPARLRRYGR